MVDKSDQTKIITALKDDVAKLKLIINQLSKQILHLEKQIRIIKHDNKHTTHAVTALEKRARS